MLDTTNMTARDLAKHYYEVRKRVRDTVPKLKLVEVQEPVTVQPNSEPPVSEYTRDEIDRLMSELSSIEQRADKLIASIHNVMPQKKSPYPKLSAILARVCRHYKIARIDLLSDRRTANLVRPRHIAFYLMKTMTPQSLPAIGYYMGGRDHTTVLHAVRKITVLMEHDEGLREEIEYLKQAILAE